MKFVDLYQLHWPNPRIRSGDHEGDGRAGRDGKTRYIGVSNFSVEQTMQAQESLPRSELVSNQMRYSITSRSIEADVLPFCRKEKITVIAYSPLDTGNIPAEQDTKGHARRSMR